jgi:hypothetical protein
MAAEAVAAGTGERGASPDNAATQSGRSFETRCKATCVTAFACPIACRTDMFTHEPSAP